MKQSQGKKFAIFLIFLVFIQETRGRLHFAGSVPRIERNDVNYHEDNKETSHSSLFGELLNDVEKAREAEAPEKENEENTEETGLTNENPGDKRKRAGALTTFILINGVISAGFDVYKYERGCKDWPTYVSNLNAIQRELPILRDTRDLINLRWNDFYNVYHYYERLNAQAKIIQILSEDYEKLKQAIVITLDPSIEAKLKNASADLSQQIATNNLTNTNIDYNYLQNAFLSKFKLAFSLIKNLRSIAWMAGKALVNKIIDLTASDEAAVFVEENPTRFQQFLDYVSLKKAQLEGWYAEKVTVVNAKITEFKLALESRVLSYIEAHPRLQQAYDYLFAEEEGSLSRWAAAKKKLTVVGKGLIFAGLVAYDIYLLDKFVKECNNRQKNSQDILDTIRSRQSEMNTLKANVDQHIVWVGGNYTSLKSKFTEQNFTKYLRAMQEIIKNSTDPSPAQLKAVTDIDAFINGISTADYARTETLVETLIDALRAINKDLDCLEKRLHILQEAYHRCSNGFEIFDQVYTIAVENERIRTRHCFSAGYIQKSELQTFVFGQLTDHSKQTACLRNNKAIFDNVCHAIKNNGNPLTVHAGLTSADIDYFRPLCPKNTLTQAQIQNICYEKGEGKTISYILTNLYKSIKFEAAEVTKAYDACALPYSKVQLICNLKGEKNLVDVAVAKYSLYPPALVSRAYQDCGPTAAVNSFICLGRSLDKDITGDYTSFYPANVLKSLYDACPPKTSKKDTNEFQDLLNMFEDPTESHHSGLSSAKVLAICKMKYGIADYTLHQTVERFFTDSEEAVTMAYNNCQPPSITEFRENICAMRNVGRTFHSLFAHYGKYYSEEDVRFVFDGCMPPAVGK